LGQNGFAWSAELIKNLQPTLEQDPEPDIESTGKHPCSAIMLLPVAPEDFGRIF
jgi:hypothetical protein